ncbi:MAG TPA: TM2 domain-containing protein [Coleofasciculaceae cyanobacterium]
MNTPGLNNTGTSYLLWLTCLFGVSGIHRFYNKKPISGTLWLLTWGFFGIGQFIDLFLMPGMVEEHNLRQRAKLGLLPGGAMLSQPTIQLVMSPEMLATATPRTQAALEVKPEPKPLTQHDIMLKLLKAAQLRNGKLSVTQAVMDTELGFDQVGTAMQEMVRMGYVAIENHPESGVVLYNFLEL